MSHSPRIDTLMSWLLEFCKGRQKLRPSSYPSRYPFIWVTRRLCWHFFPPTRISLRLLHVIELPSFQLVYSVYHPPRFFGTRERISRFDGCEKGSGTETQTLGNSQGGGFSAYFHGHRGKTNALPARPWKFNRRWKPWTTVLCLKIAP